MDPDQSYYFGSLRIRIRNTDSNHVIHDMCPVLFYRVLRYRGVVCEGGLPRLHGLVQCQVSSELGMRHIFGCSRQRVILQSATATHSFRPSKSDYHANFVHCAVDVKSGEIYQKKLFVLHSEKSLSKRLNYSFKIILYFISTLLQYIISLCNVECAVLCMSTLQV